MVKGQPAPQWMQLQLCAMGKGAATVADDEIGPGLWGAFLCDRPPLKLYEHIVKKRLAFYEAARRLSPEEILDLVPITFPITNVVDRGLCPGVGKIDVDGELRRGAPYFSMTSWITLCMKIALGDMHNLGSIFDTCEQLSGIIRL